MSIGILGGMIMGIRSRLELGRINRGLQKENRALEEGL
jgi:hypothetical protein